MRNTKARKFQPVLSPANGANLEVVSVRKSLTAPVSPAGGPALDEPGKAGLLGVAEKIKELVRLAQEQGHLTYGDIHEVFPDDAVTPVLLDEIYANLQALEIEIIDQAEVDRVKVPEEEAEESNRYDVLDDPVRMYLKQMGMVALLTREEEVAISKRIEAAEEELRDIIYALGFTAKEHIALAEKLLEDPPRERFDRVVLEKKVDSRDAYLRSLRRHLTRVRELDCQVDVKFIGWRDSREAQRAAAAAEFGKLREKLQETFGKFYFKHKVVEEMAMVAGNIHDKFHYGLRALAEAERQRESGPQKHLVAAEWQKLRALEEFVRMSHEAYLAAFQALIAASTRAVQAKTEMVEAQVGLHQNRDGGGQPAPGDFHC